MVGEGARAGLAMPWTRAGQPGGRGERGGGLGSYDQGAMQAQEGGWKWNWVQGSVGRRVGNGCQRGWKRTIAARTKTGGRRQSRRGFHLEGGGAGRRGNELSDAVTCRLAVRRMLWSFILAWGTRIIAARIQNGGRARGQRLVGTAAG